MNLVPIKVYRGMHIIEDKKKKCYYIEVPHLKDYRFKTLDSAMKYLKYWVNGDIQKELKSIANENFYE